MQGAFESAPAPEVVQSNIISDITQDENSSFPSHSLGDAVHGTSVRSFIPQSDNDLWGSPKDPNPWNEVVQSTLPLVQNSGPAPSIQDSTSVPSPPSMESNGWVSPKTKTQARDTSLPAPARLSKEEKSAEMARRKEERKQVGLNVLVSL
jgi:hypothetical protein